MSKYLKYAWKCTTTIFGGKSAVLSLLAIPVVGFVIHYKVAGEDAMKAELYIWAIYTLGAALLLSIPVFLWNLICAPYRIEKEKRRELEEAIKEKPPTSVVHDRSISTENQSGGVNVTGDVTFNTKDTSLKARIRERLSATDPRIVDAIDGGQKVLNFRMGELQLNHFDTLLNEAGSAEFIASADTIKKHINSTLMDGKMGATSDPVMFELCVTVKEALQGD